MLIDNKNKALIVVLVLCCFTKTFFSQTVYTNKETQSFGFTVGMTSSDIYRDTINYEQGIFFNGGLVYTLSFSDKSNIGMELLYTGKKVKRSKPIMKFAFSYIDVPVYYQLKLSDNFKLNLGIQYSNYVNATYDTLDGSKSNGVHTQPLTTTMGNDFGVLAGLEFGITKNLFVSARYTLSVKSFAETQSPYFGVFQFSFKYVVFRGYKQLFKKRKETATAYFRL